MNYKKQYIKLIRKAQQNPLPEYWLNGQKIYMEKHHIFPKSIFGKNKTLVKLMTKEHYVAHHLLWKYYQKKYGNKNSKTQKMMNSFWLMNGAAKKVGSRIYCILRELKRENLLGSNHSIETRQKMSLAAFKHVHFLGKKHSDETKRLCRNATIFKMKPVERIDKITGEVKEYDCVNSATKDGFHAPDICKVCKGKQKAHKGYFWKYLEN